MARKSSQLNPGLGGDVFDTYQADDEPVGPLRQIIRLAGKLGDQLVDVISSVPAGTEEGVVTRNIPSGTQTTDPSDRVGRLLGVLSAGANVIGKVGLDAANLAGIALDVTVAAVRDRLPAALTAGGGVKVGIVDPLPAGTSTIGKVDQGLGGASAWRVDGSAFTQPVSGTVTANAGTGTFATDPVDDVARKLGQAFLRNPGDTANMGDVATPVRIDPTGTTTQPVSAASLPLPSGAAQEHVTAVSPHSVRLSDGAAFYDSTKTGQLPSALVTGRLDANTGAWMGSTAPTIGQKTMANSLPIAIASDQSSISIGKTITPSIFYPLSITNNYTVPILPTIKPLVVYTVPTGKTLTILGYTVRTSAVGVEFYLMERKTMWKYQSVVLPAPTFTVVAKTISGVSGLMAPGTYRYKVAAVNHIGRTVSAEVAVTLTSPANAVTVTITAPTTGNPLYYEIYRTIVGGPVNAEFFSGATTGTTVYVDTLPDSALAAAIPASSTTNTGANGIDASAYTGGADVPSIVIIDVMPNVITAVTIDIVYKDRDGLQRYLSQLTAVTGSVQYILVPPGISNPTGDIRITPFTSTQSPNSIQILDILGTATNPTTGGYLIYGYRFHVADGSKAAGAPNSVILTNPFSFTTGTELVVGITATAAITTAIRQEFHLIATLE